MSGYESRMVAAVWVACGMRRSAGTGGDATLVASGVLPGSAWSPTGATLMARAADGRELLLVRPGEAGAVDRVQLPEGAASFTWQPILEGGWTGA